MCRAGRAATARWRFHLFRVVEAFLDANEGTTLVQATFREEPAADADTADARRLRREVRQRFKDWWANGDTRRKALADLLRPAEPA